MCVYVCVEDEEEGVICTNKILAHFSVEVVEVMSALLMGCNTHGGLKVRI